jgi:Holliday junction resolvasome RuvABC endonuclease subunit
VIKLDVVPVTGVVAAGAIAAQITLMNIIFAVARLAGVGRIAVFLACRMTTIAGCLGMLTEQFEVSERVIERRFIQSHDIHVTAFMVGMARGASLIADVCRPAVKAKRGADVLRYILMAVQTQGILLRTTESLVARRTFRLKLRMPLNHRTWHDQ